MSTSTGCRSMPTCHSAAARLTSGGGVGARAGVAISLIVWVPNHCGVWILCLLLALSGVDNNLQGDKQVQVDAIVDDVDDEPWVWGCDGTDQDLKFDQRIGGSWQGDTEQEAGTFKSVRAETFTHSSGNGGARVIGLLVMDKRDRGTLPAAGDGETGFARYLEVELAPGPSEFIPPRPFNPLIRM